MARFKKLGKFLKNQLSSLSPYQKIGIHISNSYLKLPEAHSEHIEISGLEIFAEIVTTVSL